MILRSTKTHQIPDGRGAGAASEQDRLQDRTRGGWIHRFANPGRFQRLVRPIVPWVAGTALVVTVIGLVWGFFFSPPDWQQGIASRIMYVHVPAAWLALNGYALLAICSLFSIVWRHPLADIAAKEISPVGAGFTLLCLISDSLWGRPEWGSTGCGLHASPRC